MILLTTTSDSLIVVTSAIGAIDVHASWVDKEPLDVFTPGRLNTPITTAASTEVVGAPGLSIQRTIQSLYVRNKHASSSNTITIIHNDGSTLVELYKEILQAGETLSYEDEVGFTKTGTAATMPGGVPVGGIILWSGTIASIPATWALCDGVSNTPGPDLRDKFVVGAKQDDAGVAKSNILGSLSQTGGATGHSHSGHGDLTHSGGAVGDHTGLTHGLSVANHPDLTHAAIGDHASFALAHADHASGVVISIPSQAIASGADISIASQSVSVPSQAIASAADISIASHTVSIPSQAIPSGADISIASFTMGQASAAGVNSFATSTNRSGLTARAAYTHTIPAHTGDRPTLPVSSVAGSASAITGSRPTLAVASVAGSASAITGSRPTLPVAAVSGSMPALSHADHSVAALTHGGVGTHAATDYGVHSFTAPPAHGTAGTVTHSFTQPSDHSLSAHDTVSMVPSFFALAYIQRMS